MKSAIGAISRVLSFGSDRSFKNGPKDDPVAEGGLAGTSAVEGGAMH